MPVDPTPSASRHRHSRKDQDGGRSDGNYAREIEMKRSRGEISCAECRRLKIKCDKQIPCQSCQRRGCAALCPNGSLATGQGTRFVIAATEHLHKRIARMSDRIRQLEDALAVLQASHTSEQHPLLQDSMLILDQDKGEDRAVESDDGDEPREALNAFGTMSISDGGVSRFFGPTGGSEGLLRIDQEDSQSPNSGSTRSSKSPPLPPEIARFSFAFPFTPMGPTHEVHLLILTYLPPYEVALSICETFLNNAAWLFRGVSREQLLDEMVPIIYKIQPSPPNVSIDVDYTSSHALGLFLSILSVGRIVDINLTTAAAEAEGEHYNQLAMAALCLHPVLERPSLITIQALHVASIYNAMSGSEVSGGESTMETSWSLVALAAHLSHTIGLHRDSARWEPSLKMVQRRRMLFWDLFVADSWHTMSTGRPPSFQREYIDCQYPQDTEMKLDVDGNTEPGFGSWGFRFAYECIAEVAAKTLTATPPRYSEILELDRKIREFKIPTEALAMLRGGHADMRDMPLSASMVYFVLSHTREVILLFVHRSYFAQALVEDPVNPLRSQYAPSFLATVRSANTVLRVIRDQFAMQPALCSRFWSMWTFAFSSAIVFGVIVTRAPRSHLADTAMSELEQACDLFTEAAKYNRRAAKAYAILNRLRDKASRTLMTARQHDPALSVEDGTAWDVKKEDVDDELAIFAGRTKVLRSGQPCNSSPQPQVLVQPYTNLVSGPTPTLPPISPHELANWQTHSSPQSQIPSSFQSQSTQPLPPALSQQQYIDMSNAYRDPASSYSDISYPSVPSQFPPQQTPEHPPRIPLPSQRPTRQPQMQHQHPQHQGQPHYNLSPDPDAIRLYPPHAYSQQQTIPVVPGSTNYSDFSAPPNELVQLGLAPTSRLQENWNTFMRQSGIIG